MRRRMTRLALAFTALAALVALGAALAVASPGHPAKHQKHATLIAKKFHKSSAAPSVKREASPASEKPETPGETETGAPESAADEAAQAAACNKAGIDPNGPNVQYDDATGKCSLDTGGNTGNG